MFTSAPDISDKLPLKTLATVKFSMQTDECISPTTVTFLGKYLVGTAQFSPEVLKIHYVADAVAER